MAYTNSNWTCISASLNQGQLTVTPFGGSPTVENAPNIFMYGSPNDTVATISAANYFLAEYASLSVGDWIMGFGTDASFSLQVTAVSSTSVTSSSMRPPRGWNGYAPRSKTCNTWPASRLPRDPAPRPRRCYRPDRGPKKILPPPWMTILTPL